MLFYSYSVILQVDKRMILSAGTLTAENDDEAHGKAVRLSSQGLSLDQHYSVAANLTLQISESRLLHALQIMENARSDEPVAVVEPATEPPPPEPHWFERVREWFRWSL